MLAALLTILLTPVVLILLCITVLGIAAIPFIAIALLCAVVFGKRVRLRVVLRVLPKGVAVRIAPTLR